MKFLRILLATASFIGGTQIAAMGCGSGGDCHCPAPNHNQLLGTFNVLSAEVEAQDAGMNDELTALEMGVVTVTADRFTISYPQAGHDNEIVYLFAQDN